MRYHLSICFYPGGETAYTWTQSHPTKNQGKLKRWALAVLDCPNLSTCIASTENKAKGMGREDCSSGRPDPLRKGGVGYSACGSLLSINKHLLDLYCVQSTACCFHLFSPNISPFPRQPFPPPQLELPAWSTPAPRPPARRRRAPKPTGKHCELLRRTARTAFPPAKVTNVARKPPAPSLPASPTHTCRPLPLSVPPSPSSSCRAPAGRASGRARTA